MRTNLCILVLFVGVLCTLTACRTFRQERRGGAKAPLSVESLLQHPFQHGGTIAEFQTELPTLRPTRMLFQPVRFRKESDTLYEFLLPKESKIILYRSAQGEERFMAATLGEPTYRLNGGIHVGLSLDSLRMTLWNLPEPVADTLRLRAAGAPYEVHFYFRSEAIERMQVLGQP